ncbi:MAG: MerR family transcriptional regulator [Nitrospirae bacterium]|nr:MerR family transcriptional regulator [Nitrospirota bacterium]
MVKKIQHRGPEKLFYKIREVSEITGLEAYVLRYWESEFPVLSPRKSKGGQRVYEQKDIDMVLKIKRMLYEEGFTIEGARKRLLQGTPSVTQPEVVLRIRQELQGILNVLNSSGRGAAR